MMPHLQVHGSGLNAQEVDQLYLAFAGLRVPSQVTVDAAKKFVAYNHVATKSENPEDFCLLRALDSLLANWTQCIREREYLAAAGFMDVDGEKSLWRLHDSR
jgi:hypothetical protein